jgi:hypothetical protein
MELELDSNRTHHAVKYKEITIELNVCYQRYKQAVDAYSLYACTSS